MPRKTSTTLKAALPKQAEHKFGSKAAAHVQDGGKAAPTKTTKKVGKKAAQAGPSSTNTTQGGATTRAPSTSYARSPPSLGPSNFRGNLQEAVGFIQWWDEYKEQLSPQFTDYQVATLFLACVQVERYQDIRLQELKDIKYSYDRDLVKFVEDDFIMNFLPRDNAREEYAEDPTWEDPEEDQDPEDDPQQGPEDAEFPQEDPEPKYDGGEWENHGDEPDYKDADPMRQEWPGKMCKKNPIGASLHPVTQGNEESVEERHELSPSHTSNPADDATDPWTDKGEMFHNGHSQTPWDPLEWCNDNNEDTEDSEEFYDTQEFQDSAADRPDEEDPYAILNLDYDYDYEEPQTIRKRVEFFIPAKSQPPPQYYKNVDSFVPLNQEEVYYSMPPGEAREQYTPPQGTWVAEVQQACQELTQAQESSWYPFRDHIDGMDMRPGRIRVNAAKYGHIRPLCPDIWRPRVHSRSLPTQEEHPPLDPQLKSAIINFLMQPSNYSPRTTAVRRGHLPKKEGDVTFRPEPRATSADLCSTAELYHSEWVTAARTEGIDPAGILHYERDLGWQAPWE
ncbi:hypothetical protein EDB87DRAFT_1575949 [Lactarius vividus]|nr:hypothetical protein EDB87DRAFT_1575949 [Lactarius vividus]